MCVCLCVCVCVCVWVCVCVCVSVIGVRQLCQNGNPYSNSLCWSGVTLIDSWSGISRPDRQLIKDQSDSWLSFLVVVSLQCRSAQTRCRVYSPQTPTSSSLVLQAVSFYSQRCYTLTRGLTHCLHAQEAAVHHLSHSRRPTWCSDQQWCRTACSHIFINDTHRKKTSQLQLVSYKLHLLPLCFSTLLLERRWSCGEAVGVMMDQWSSGLWQQSPVFTSCFSWENDAELKLTVTPWMFADLCCWILTYICKKILQGELLCLWDAPSESLILTGTSDTRGCLCTPGDRRRVCFKRIFWLWRTENRSLLRTTQYQH